MEKLSNKDLYILNPNKCKECQKVLELGNLKLSDIKRRKFCSHSCAASFNNRGICRNEKKIKLCECGNVKTGKAKKCIECIKNNLGNKTLQEIIGGRKYTVTLLHQIRSMARKILNQEKVKQCNLCNHNEFKDVLEVCHIKGIMKFSLDTKIKEINHIDNLIWLCPSHHRLFDKDLIKMVVGSAG